MKVGFVDCVISSPMIVDRALQSYVEEVKQAQKDVEAYKKIVALCKEFQDVTERLGELERERAEVEEEKKDRAHGRAGPGGEAHPGTGRAR